MSAFPKVFVQICILLAFMFSLAVPYSWGQGGTDTLTGRVVDENGRAVVGVTVAGEAAGQREQVATGSEGSFRLSLPPGDVILEASGAYVVPEKITVPRYMRSQSVILSVRYAIGAVHRSVLVTAPGLEPGIDRRNDAVYQNALFSRDDQVFDVLAAGINVGQHEGGGKSIEVRRFGFNLDHGGVGGGLKVMFDNVQQNQGTQGHGQGYLGALKSLTPELVEGVDILNGPFSAEYGDFSGLGVVHVRLRERLPDRYMARLQGGSFGALRTFLAWSPRRTDVDSYVAYEGSGTDGPFVNPLNYRRDNLSGNYTWHRNQHEAVGFKLNLARNVFDSSGQIPLDEVDSGRLDRFGAIDPLNGGKNYSGTLSSYYSKEWEGGDTFKIDGFVSRWLFDLWSNFTFFLNDPLRGDQIQQHDSRLIEGVNAQWRHPWRFLGNNALLTVGSNFHDNQILIGLFRTEERAIFETTTLAN
ncbi:MAG: carboxypeptidase regulatory-like domain-containing protein, partial [Candidatus Korobacteraceae bacterium]